jgi:hypothetical protein
MDIPQDKRIPLVVPSDRIAQMAKSMGYLAVAVAENALPKAMYKAVKKSLSID